MRLISFLLLACLSLPLFAVVETYDFGSDNNRERYQVLVDELRCPKCQNQNLAGSNSPIAKDLRRELHRMIEAGQNDDAIKAFMVKRYGNFVLYDPPLDTKTYLLWGAPAILGFVAMLFVIALRFKSVEAPSSNLSAEETQRLAEILNKYS